MSLDRRLSHRQDVAVLAVLVSAVLVSFAPAGKPASQPKIDGTYKATVKGQFRGKGQVVVTPVGVVVLGSVSEEKSGKKGALISPTLGLKDGHFFGTGVAANTVVNIIGRVEPADGQWIKAERVFITMTDAAGNATRLVAVK